MAEPPRQRQRRHLNYDKCRFCRNAKKACKPVGRIWPQKCRRCTELELECSENTRSAGAPPSLTTQPNNQAIDVKTIHDLSLRVGWLRRLQFYHKATEALVYAQEKVSNRWTYEMKVRPKFAFVKDEETSFVTDFFDETTSSNHPLAAFITLAFETGDTSFRHYPPYDHPLKEVAEAKVDHFRESGDISTALAMQEIVLLNEFESVSDAILASNLQKYCEISSEMAERLKMMLGREVPAVPPLHLLSLLTKGKIISKLTLPHSQFLATKDCFGRSLLHVALDLRVTADVLRLVKFDITIAAGDIWDRWPIHIACSGDSEAVVKYVLDNTADHDIDHDIEDCLGRSPLHYASGSGNESTVRLLVEQGASVSHEDQNRRTPVLCAAEYGHTAVFRLLLKNGADVSTKDEYGETALFKGAENGHTAVIKLLLENGADVAFQSIYGKTALFKGARYGHTAVIELLLGNGANVNTKDKRGETVLFEGARYGHTAVVQLLLESGADITSQNHIGETALLKSAENGHIAVVKLLLENGANINSQNNIGETVLLKSAENGHTAVVQLLLENGANDNSQSHIGETGLLKSVENGHIAVVKLLLESGANVTSQNIYGETALLLGVGGRHTAVVKLLLENGADPSINLPWGDSPLKAAVRKGYKEIAELLRSWGAELDSSYDSSESSD